VVPDQPQQAHRQAAMDLAGTLARRSGGRALQLRLLPLREALKVASTADFVIVGQPADYGATWSTAIGPALQNQLGVTADSSGRLVTRAGQVVDAANGLVAEIGSPWDADRRIVLATGTTPDGFKRAAVGLGSDTARRTMAGPVAVITDDPREPEAARQRSLESLTDFTLSDLGFPDRSVQGWGNHLFNIAFDSTGIPQRGATARIIYDHSRVVNSGVSAVAISLNDIPLIDAALVLDRTDRAVLEAQLPPKVLRVGRNVLQVRFSLAPRRGGTGPGESVSSNQMDCRSLPPELAWAVVFSDSSIHLPPGTAGGAGLGSFPFPFVREGRVSDTLLVLPDDILEAENAASFTAEFARSVNSDLVGLKVTTASQLTQEEKELNNLIAFGLPGNNSLLTDIAPQLPLRFDARGRVVQGLQGPLAAVRDSSDLGVLQTLASPYNPARAILVVTATSREGLTYAVRGLARGNLQGNLAAIGASSVSAVTASGPAPSTQAQSSAVQVRTFDVPVLAQEVAPSIKLQESVPIGITALAAIGAGIVIIGTGAVGWLAARRRGTARVGAAPAQDEWDDWLLGPESKELDEGTK
jgi:hypothetical protein